MCGGGSEMNGEEDTAGCSDDGGGGGTPGDGDAAGCCSWLCCLRRENSSLRSAIFRVLAQKERVFCSPGGCSGRSFQRSRDDASNVDAEAFPSKHDDAVVIRGNANRCQ